MKQLTIQSNGKDILLMQIYDDYATLNKFKISGTNYLCVRDLFTGKWEVANYRPLPPGNYHIIGKASELTEEQWKEIILSEKAFYIGRYRDYTTEDPFIELFTAAQSGLSLLTKHGFRKESTVILQLIKSDNEKVHDQI